MKKQKWKTDFRPLILEMFMSKKKKNFFQKKILSPAARKMAAESKIDLEEIQGTGKNGLFLKKML